MNAPSPPDDAAPRWTMARFSWRDIHDRGIYIISSLRCALTCGKLYDNSPVSSLVSVSVSHSYASQTSVRTWIRHKYTPPLVRVHFLFKKYVAYLSYLSWVSCFTILLAWKRGINYERHASGSMLINLANLARDSGAHCTRLRHPSCISDARNFSQTIFRATGLG